MSEKWARVKLTPTDRGTYRTTEELDIQYKGLVVPKGFETDGASIPKALWSMIGGPFGAKYITAAVIHDYLYGAGVTEKWEDDELFRIVMKDHGVGWIKRRTMYLGVRLFGKSSKV